MNGWISQYQRLGALWIHDGNPKRPHALLASGNHSNGFFNSRLVIADEELLLHAAFDLRPLFTKNGGDALKVKGVVGPQTGATKLSKLVAMQFSIYNRSNCFWASPAKHEEGGVKSMVFSDEELSLIPGQFVLLCEDVITTGGSVDLTAEAVAEAGGATLPYILALVNRSGLEEVDGKKIVALIDRPMPMWAPEDCPLCKEGSKAIRLKGPEEWALLNATY